jgi:hypothetical protein
MEDILIAQLPEAGEYIQGWLGAALGIGGSIISGIFGNASAKRAEREAAKRKQELEAKLVSLENQRQPVINPYAEIESVAGLAENLSSQMYNPMASLGVATQAAEMQAEQADIALANTLDTIRATGASAGGATALAQAALASKKGVAASIEAQEANNERLRAQGEQTLQAQKLAEEQRIQGIQMSEAQRLQQSDVLGKTFEYGEKEKRELTQLDRVQAQIEGAQAREQQARADRTGAITGMVGGIASGLGGLASAGAFSGGSKLSKTPTPTTTTNRTYSTPGYAGLPVFDFGSKQ